jgi:DNA-binding transcriptional ArsR family regulator
VIDSLREQIQQGIDQLLGEVERLRKALAALDPRSEKPSARKPPARSPRTRASTRGTSSRQPTSSPPRGASRRASASGTRPAGRTAPGATKSAVLDALADGQAMTAGEVAAKTGLARPTVSTTLSKLANSGEVQKAERGYRRAATASS